MSQPNLKTKYQLFQETGMAECKRHGAHPDWQHVTPPRRAIICMPCRRQVSKEYAFRFRNKITDYRKKYADSFWGELVSSCRKRSKERGWQCTLTKAFLKQINTEQGNRCVYSGAEFSPKQRPSVDRIDSSKPYTQDNVQLVTWAVNRAKATLSHQEFIDLCCQISRRHGPK